MAAESEEAKMKLAIKDWRRNRDRRGDALQV